MFHIPPDQQENEQNGDGKQDDPSFGENYPVEEHSRADAAKKRVGPPKRSLFQPREGDHIDKTDRLHRHRPRHEDAKASVVGDIEPYRNGNEDDVQHRDDVMPILVAVLAKELQGLFHRAK